ncbi:hypothetical protein GH714_010889 [Hevea brasiliensis]|uniref:ABC-type xenobiotic transporter n=1 Tax=Hevea brasiliensis TaxID=3981 RepID=A0A6A6MM61_HEVBR|nr:hypothetical protein GH714_010889 [Hevea brasiliensis]
MDKKMLGQFILEIFSFPGAILFLICCFKGHIYTGTDSGINDDASYESLPSEQANAIGSKENVTPFAKAGFFSRMSFWWLNPLMKKGKEKILEDEDIPLLRQEDQAKTCFLTYMEQIRRRRQKGSSESPSMLSVIISLHWKEILISGFFALTKVVTTSAGPLFLMAFIDVAEGKAAFTYAGYVLTVGLFLVKCLESLSERQWFFRTRLIGLQVRSMLSAAIYQKQLRLSNAAKVAHSPGQIVNYVTADAYRIGEFPFWCHQIWSTFFQLCLALPIVYYTVGLATVAAVIAIILTVLASYPLIKSQVKYQRKLMVAQDKRLKAITEALANMKALKLYAWETLFKNAIEGLRKEEIQWILGVLLQKAYQIVLFWSCPVLIPAITFWTCYILRIPLSASQVFTFLASLRIVQEPVRLIPDVVGTFIEAKVSLDRIATFLEAPELQNRNIRRKCSSKELNQSIFIESTEISWDTDSSKTKATLRNINLVVQAGEKIAICGEVGSGKSTLLAAVLGEVPKINGTVHVYGTVAYVSQAAWIQTGTIKENILFGSALDPVRYHEALKKCSLVKDLQMLPFGDLTQIGERGVNLSGGQKQRIQLARALYQDADVYLLDDPLRICLRSFVYEDSVTRDPPVEFLPAFNSILLMFAGEIIQANTYDQLLASSQEFQSLVNAQKNSAASDRQVVHTSDKRGASFKEEIQKVHVEEQLRERLGDQLIKQEEEK